MFALMLALSSFGAPVEGGLEPVRASINPRANELFEREPVLKIWALQRFDANKDGWLTLYEAQPAADAFREIADINRDGQVSLREYGAAIDFIRVRY